MIRFPDPPIPGGATRLARIDSTVGRVDPPVGQVGPVAGLESGTVRVGITVAALAGLLAGWLVVRRLGRRARVRSGLDDHRVGTGELVAFTALVVATAVVVAVTWDVGTAVRREVARIGDDPTLGVRTVLSLLSVAAGYGIVQVVGRVLAENGADGPVDHRREAAFHVVQVTVYLLAGLVVLSVWRVDVGNLLVGAGFLGLVVGLAARQTLGAVIAGFVLLFARPFQVGDWVVVGDREGIVADVTVLDTRLRTPAGEWVTIPNDTVAGSEIVNRSREGRLRTAVEVGVDYETDVQRAAGVARQAVEDCEEVLAEPSPRVVGKRFDDSAVVLELRFWLDDPTPARRWEAHSAVVAAVKAAFDREGIAIPFPQRTLGARDGAVTLAGDPPGRPVAGPRDDPDGEGRGTDDAPAPATDGGDGSEDGDPVDGDRSSSTGDAGSGDGSDARDDSRVRGGDGEEYGDGSDARDDSRVRGGDGDDSDEDDDGGGRR